MSRLSVGGGYSSHWLDQLPDPWGGVQVSAAIPARARPQPARAPGQGARRLNPAAHPAQCITHPAGKLWGWDTEGVQAADLSGVWSADWPAGQAHAGHVWPAGQWPRPQGAHGRHPVQSQWQTVPSAETGDIRKTFYSIWWISIKTIYLFYSQQRLSILVWETIQQFLVDFIYIYRLFSLHNNDYVYEYVCVLNLACLLPKFCSLMYFFLVQIVGMHRLSS